MTNHTETMTYQKFKKTELAKLYAEADELRAQIDAFKTRATRKLDGIMLAFMHDYEVNKDIHGTEQESIWDSERCDIAQQAVAKLDILMPDCWVYPLTHGKL